ncbi:hypothetical protein [Paenibacillus polymyxa]|uniref:hypothetical protein n=1 Tax=Paenibacillus polymyxa TaxID=1406 RepID=UPI002AB505E3|nr:hypothetical protein [Paenibacillus polymyxa]MDY8021195.1 hypothetical protein [Paenibacillus polymyxa]
MTNEATVYYWDQEGNIGVTVMSQNQAKKEREVRFTARDLVNHKIELSAYALSNELFAVKERVGRIVEAETKLSDFYKSVNEIDLRSDKNYLEIEPSVQLINGAIKELEEMKSKLENLKLIK